MTQHQCDPLTFIQRKSNDGATSLCPECAAEWWCFHPRLRMWQRVPFETDEA